MPGFYLEKLEEVSLICNLYMANELKSVMDVQQLSSTVSITSCDSFAEYISRYFNKENYVKMTQ